MSEANERIRFNINDSVYVKLTEFGFKFHMRHYARILPQDVFEKMYRSPKVDEQGFSKFQLWDLMNIFGENCSMACEQPFSTEIEFEKK